MTYQRISILGCGWLGFPLAMRLLEMGHFVRGSTTTKDKIPLLEQSGIEPWFIQLNPHLIGDDPASFFDVDTVVLNIPPPRVEDRVAFMMRQADDIVSHISASPVKRLIMVSSTGVYAAKGQDADEEDPWPPESVNGKGLVAMETKLMEELTNELSEGLTEGLSEELTEGLSEELTRKLTASVAVVRMAGLFGPDRNPGRFLAGRSVSGNGDEPVNMIHLEDAIGVISALIEQPDVAGVFNACAREHPTRREFYRKASEKTGFEMPVFADGEARAWKRIVSEKIRNATGYSFMYDNPIEGFDDL